MYHKPQWPCMCELSVHSMSESLLPWPNTVYVLCNRTPEWKGLGNMLPRVPVRAQYLCCKGSQLQGIKFRMASVDMTCWCRVPCHWGAGGKFLWNQISNYKKKNWDSAGLSDDQSNTALKWEASALKCDASGRIRDENLVHFSRSQLSVLKKSCAVTSRVVVLSKSDTFEPASANKTLMHQLMWLGKNKTRDAPKQCTIFPGWSQCFHVDRRGRASPLSGLTTASVRIVSSSQGFNCSLAAWLWQRHHAPQSQT